MTKSAVVHRNCISARIYPHELILSSSFVPQRSDIKVDVHFHIYSLATRTKMSTQHISGSITKHKIDHSLI